MPAKVRKPNLTLIAKKCGMSKMTVSRVLRNEPNVSPSTRDFILRAAEKVGFLPTGTGRRTGDMSAREYYILFQSEYSQKGTFFSGIILNVQQELFTLGFGCAVGVIQDEYADFLKLSHILSARHVQGVLVVGEIPAHYAVMLQTNLLDVVFIDYPGDPGFGRPYNAVCIENVYGGHLALDHLLKLGRKRILLISGREGHYFSNDMLRAYRETLAQHNLEFDPRLIINGNFHSKDSFRAVKGALEAGLRFDGIFSNDEMACGAIKALKLAGLKVPADVSVVGFDGLPIGELVSPTLTTVVVDREKMSRLAVKRLLALNQEIGDDEKFEKISIFPQLLVRESCGGATGAAA